MWFCRTGSPQPTALVNKSTISKGSWIANPRFDTEKHGFYEHIIRGRRGRFGISSGGSLRLGRTQALWGALRGFPWPQNPPSGKEGMARNRRPGAACPIDRMRSKHPGFHRADQIFVEYIGRAKMGIVEIGHRAFAYKEISSITIPEGGCPYRGYRVYRLPPADGGQAARKPYQHRGRRLCGLLPPEGHSYTQGRYPYRGGRV